MSDFQIRLDVSARLKGQVKAAYAEDRRNVLPDPLIIVPIKEEQYFEASLFLSLDNSLYLPMVVFAVIFQKKAFVHSISIAGFKLLFFFTLWFVLQPKQPFSLLTLLKSPMGLMVAGALLVVFVLPKLLEMIGEFVCCQ